MLGLLWAVSVAERPQDYGQLCFKDLICNNMGKLPLGVHDEGKLLGKTVRRILLDCWSQWHRRTSYSLVCLRNGAGQIQELWTLSEMKAVERLRQKGFFSLAFILPFSQDMD